MALTLADFDYALPPELIAQAPATERRGSRLLQVDGDALRDRTFADILDMVAPGDLMVFNDTRVLRARMHGRRPSGGRVELLLERITGPDEAWTQLRASHPPRVGGTVLLDDAIEATVLARDDRFFHLRFAGLRDASLEDWLERHGEVPLPPYITHRPDAADAKRYQTIYARHAGAVAAPTAGLHFDAALLDELRARGIDFGYITLHVGAGTFQPVRAEKIEDHEMHREWLNVGAELVEKIHRARARGGRVVAVGTTVVRALEAARGESGEVEPFAGETRIFIFPGYRIASVDGLITNFHLPESTLLMLVSAFAGREFVLSAYRHAVERRYRFYSYGDAMLVFPMEHGE